MHPMDVVLHMMKKLSKDSKRLMIKQQEVFAENCIKIYDTPPKINMEPGNGGFQVRNLLFQGAPIFRFQPLIFGGCIYDLLGCETP